MLLTTDVAIIGGGPAGMQAATWCTQSKVDHILIEGDTIGGLQAKSPYGNTWLGVFPQTMRAQDVAAKMRQRLKENGTRIHNGTVTLVQGMDKGFRLDIADGTHIQTRFVLLATGTRERDEALIADDKKIVGLAQMPTLDTLIGKRVAVLGSGDAAFQCGNALRKAGHEAWRIFARSTPRANRAQWAVGEGDITVGGFQIKPDRIEHNGGIYHFDIALVMYGWEAVLPLVSPSLSMKKGYVEVARSMETSVPNIFAAGDILADSHPCVASALGTASIATQMIVRRINGLPTI